MKIHTRSRGLFSWAPNREEPGGKASQDGGGFRTPPLVRYEPANPNPMARWFPKDARGDPGGGSAGGAWSPDDPPPLSPFRVPADLETFLTEVLEIARGDRDLSEDTAPSITAWLGHPHTRAFLLGFQASFAEGLSRYQTRNHRPGAAAGKALIRAFLENFQEFVLMLREWRIVDPARLGGLGKDTGGWCSAYRIADAFLEGIESATGWRPPETVRDTMKVLGYFADTVPAFMEDFGRAVPDLLQALADAGGGETEAWDRFMTQAVNQEYGPVFQGYAAVLDLAFTGGRYVDRMDLSRVLFHKPLAALYERLMGGTEPEDSPMAILTSKLERPPRELYFAYRLRRFRPEDLAGQWLAMPPERRAPWLHLLTESLPERLQSFG